MARRLKYNVRRTALNGPMLRDNSSGRSTYYHSPPSDFLKKHGRYFLLFHLLEQGRLHVDTRRGVIYRRRSRTCPFHPAKLETDTQRGYHFIRLYAKIKRIQPSGRVYYRYYRQAVCVQIVIYLVAHDLTEIPPGHEIDHRNFRRTDNRESNLKLMTVAENQARRYAKWIKDCPEAANF